MELTELLENYVVELRNMPSIESEKTIKSYKSAVIKFMKDNNRTYRMSIQELKIYMASIKVDYSGSYYNVIGSSIKILFDKIYKQPQKMNWFKAVQPKRKHLVLMTHDQVIEGVKSLDNLKHKLMILLFYSTGLRMDEMLSIKVSDINPDSDQIIVRNGKGNKSGFVDFHPLLKRYIHAYLIRYKPKDYLIEGQSGGKYSSSSVNQMLKRTYGDNMSAHYFRHLYISLVQKNHDIYYASKKARHSSVKSTEFYLHYDNSENIFNPLDVAI